MKLTTLKGFAPANLTAEQKGLWVGSPAAYLERTEVFVPIAFRYLRIRFNPKAKLIQVGNTDCTIPHALNQMLANRGGYLIPAIDPGHLVAVEYHAAEFIAKTFHFISIDSGAETLGQVEELRLLALLRFNPIFDEFDEHPVGAEPPLFCHYADLRGYAGRQTNALAHDHLGASHITSMHQSGAAHLECLLAPLGHFYTQRWGTFTRSGL